MERRNVGDLQISIHTSPKGGDTRAPSTCGHQAISIHTSPKGGDSARPPGNTLAIHFNPHLPEGR